MTIGIDIVSRELNQGSQKHKNGRMKAPEIDCPFGGHGVNILFYGNK